MSKRTRLFLFIFAVIIFVVLSYLTVVYSLGYRYDFVHRTFLPTGSFRLVANTGADVYINELLAGKTSFLSNSFSKSRLLPRTYLVRMEKTGYHPWQKNITIGGGLFSDYPKIVLLPEELPEVVVASSTFSTFTSTSYDLNKRTVTVYQAEKRQTLNLDTGKPVSSSLDIVAPKNKKTTAASAKQSNFVESSPTIVRETKGRRLEFTDHEIWVTWLNGTDFQPFHADGDRELITRMSTNISDVQWYKDREHILVWSGGILSFMEIDKRGGINTSIITALTNPFIYDEDQDAIYTFSKSNLVRIKLDF